METPVEQPEEPSAATAEPAAEQAVVDEPTVPAVPAGPSGLRLAATSIVAFLAIVAIGGLVGLAFRSNDGDVAVAAVGVPAPATSAPATTSLPTTTSLPASTSAPTTTSAPASTSAPTTTSAPVATTVAVTEPAVVVLGVTELAESVEFLELPKAVYDRYTVGTGESIAINIAANDKIGGIFQEVVLTGLGELAPGFSLDPDGTLSGTANECGTWKAQYALKSTNPAIGTSWVDITVSGCTDT